MLRLHVCGTELAELPNFENSPEWSKFGFTQPECAFGAFQRPSRLLRRRTLFTGDEFVVSKRSRRGSLRAPAWARPGPGLGQAFATLQIYSGS